MKKISKRLFGWADTFVGASIGFFIASFIGFILDSAWCGDAFDNAMILIIIAPFARGFGVLVQNAEEELAHRFDVKLEKSDDEE